MRGNFTVANLLSTQVIGGVIGAQFGARAGQRIRGEQLRLLLGLMILGVGLRFFIDLVITPTELFSLQPIETVE